MTRCYWIAAVLLLTSCHPAPPADPAGLLPASIYGKWQRTSLTSVPPAERGVLRAFRATFTGAGEVTVDLYETRASGTAFEMTQHWRETPDTVFFDKGRFFAVVKWKQADRQALTQFVRELESHLGTAK
jgi:hypothetical protein